MEQSPKRRNLRVVLPPMQMTKVPLVQQRYDTLAVVVSGFPPRQMILSLRMQWKVDLNMGPYSTFPDPLTTGAFFQES